MCYFSAVHGLISTKYSYEYAGHLSQIQTFMLSQTIRSLDSTTDPESLAVRKGKVFNLQMLSLMKKIKTVINFWFLCLNFVNISDF